jgi:hypothetical protein
VSETPDPLGFALPMELRTEGGDLRLMTMVGAFTTAAHVTVPGARLEAFPPVGEGGTALLRGLSEHGRTVSAFWTFSSGTRKK